MKKRQGFSFIDIILGVLIIMTIGLISQSTSFVMVQKSISNRNIEINKIVKSYLSQLKSECIADKTASPWNYNDNVAGERITVVGTCTAVGTSNLHQINVTVNVNSLGMTKTGEAYVYVP